MKKSDEIRKNAKRMETLAELYDRVVSIRNCSYGKCENDDENENGDWNPWEGLETEFNTCNEVLEMIMKLSK